MQEEGFDKLLLFYNPTSSQSSYKQTVTVMCFKIHFLGIYCFFYKLSLTEFSGGKEQKNPTYKKAKS